ncbi:CobW family GTP-binding protein [Aliikangiella maris]|uniref:GTP-binding protein n=2 Tax=Aliikangiella maris TaxID=3162458 RepID=A0ABV2BUL9_9GAMM
MNQIKKSDGIPTNIITGFLGVGKTTAIMHLLAQKDPTENWAILINEFGEVGIDEKLIAGQGRESSVFMREVPGGCICCAAGLPMQVALNQLIVQAQPDRILIEPTGLGHPTEIIKQLSGTNYASILQLKATITLVDARKLVDKRYTQHETFNQQLAIADILVANKADQYAETDIERLNRYIIDKNWSKSLKIVKNAAIDLTWLEQPNGYSVSHESPVKPSVNQSKPDTQTHHAKMSHHNTQSLPSNDNGIIHIQNSDGEFASSGWIIEPSFVFDFTAVKALIDSIGAERLKAVMITEQGIIGFNKVNNELTIIELDEAMDSRLEIIGTESDSWQQFGERLKGCIIAE